MRTPFLKSKLLIIILMLLYGSKSVWSQNANSFSLKEAMDYAVANSYKTKTAALDFQNTMAQRKGFISLGLPQLNASAAYQNYISLPTQIVPNFFDPGAPDLELVFGKYNNMTIGANASQLIFDGTFVVGLKAARILVEMSKANMDKSINDIRASVAQAYILTLVAQENLRILDSTYINMNEILQQNKVIQANGFMDETDIEQLSLNVTNLKSKLDYTRRNIALVSDLLKFQMGLDIDEPIVLKENLNTMIEQAIASNIIDKQFEVNAHYDFKLMKTAEMLQHQTLKVDKAKYYPSMNLILSTQSNAQRQKFDFFNNGKWYNTTLLGINLSVPIWSSGVRHYKIQQDKFNIKKQEILTKQAEEGLKIEVQNSKASLKMYTEQYFTEKKNLELSIKIYRATHKKSKEGISSSMDLNQAYLQLLTQEGTYINTIMQLLNTYTNLSKALNTL